MEGIYRVPGRQSRLEALRDSYDKGKPIDFEKQMEDPFTCADLLLLYLRSLPEPLVPQPMASEMEAAGENLSALKSVLFRLPAPNRLLLSLIARHAAQVVAAEASNKMGLKNVIIVFVPSLYCSPRVFSVLVDHAAELFVRLCSGCGVPLSGETDVVCASCEAGGDSTADQGKARSSGIRGKGGLFGGSGRHSRASPTAPGGASAVSKRPVPPIASLSGSGAGGVPAPGVAGHNTTANGTANGGMVSPLASPLPRASPRQGAVFGLSLVSQCRRQGDSGAAAATVVLPSLVRQCWKLIESAAAENGRGVYTAAAAKSSTAAIESALAARFDAGARVVLSEELVGVAEASIVAGMLLLRYLSALPGALFSADMERAGALGNVAQLSTLVFEMSLEERTFVLHFVSHIRTVVKLEFATIGALIPVFAAALRCSSELLTVLYNNRRTILQPTCLECEKTVQLFEPPVFDKSGVVICQACATKKK
jgi:hypothetical protein